MDKKLGIIVPYRDRYEQLLTFKSYMSKFLKDVDYELIVVEQDDAKIFNRGKLLNIGFIEAKKLKCDYVVFHDVDMMPVDVDYSYSPFPIHLANNFIPNDIRIIFDEYFGGVTLFPVESFEIINGYSNEYWGWGFEDTDLLYRCKLSNIELDKKEIKQIVGHNASLKFNGVDAYVKTPELKKQDFYTIFISFSLDDFVFNHEEYDDTFTIFSNSNIKLTYTSYLRYNFELLDNDETIDYISTNITTNHKTNFCITIDTILNKITVFQDGNLIDSKIYKNGFKFKRQDNFYLGSNNNKDFFKGTIDSFAIYNTILENNDINELSKNNFFGLTQSFGDYNKENNLVLYYDAKFIKHYKLIDIVNYQNDALIYNCEIVGLPIDKIKTIEIPYRRNSTFKLLNHEENGFINGGWKNITTRYNQLKYQNEVSKGYIDYKKDGLNNCEYKIHNKNKIQNLTHIVVGI